MSKYLFTIKMLVNELLTISNLHRQRPDIYLTNTCIKYKIHKEDNIYLVTCNIQINNILVKLINLNNSITDTLYQDDEIKVSVNKEIRKLYKPNNLNDK